MIKLISTIGLAAFSLGLSLLTSAGNAADEPFRPEVGKFPALEKATTYRGELVFLDHANRRGSIRVQTETNFFLNHPQPFAMLPYGIVRYHGAPADLRDIPLGTFLHVQAFLPPDPKTSVVPVIQKGTNAKPAENHVMLLEDESSYCLREGKVWKLKEVELQKNQGTILATLESKEGANAKADEQTLGIDSATRIWRGRECLTPDDLVAEGVWLAKGRKSLDGQAVLLGLTWRPTVDGVWNRLHVSDIWLDETAMQRAAHKQTEGHKAFIRSRWMPAMVDAVEYGKFGRATVTATLFGGMDPALYAEFKKSEGAMMNAAENTLKHVGGQYGPAHMASRGNILDVTTSTGEVPFGSSGVQVRFEMDLILEGIRPGRVVRIHPASWPAVQVPREEYLGDSSFNHEVRFPSPAIYPKY